MSSTGYEHQILSYENGGWFRRHDNERTDLGGYYDLPKILTAWSAEGWEIVSTTGGVNFEGILLRRKTG